MIRFTYDPYALDPLPYSQCGRECAECDPDVVRECPYYEREERDDGSHISDTD